MPPVLKEPPTPVRFERVVITVSKLTDQYAAANNWLEVNGYTVVNELGPARSVKTIIGERAI